MPKQKIRDEIINAEISTDRAPRVPQLLAAYRKIGACADLLASGKQKRLVIDLMGARIQISIGSCV